jgi:hypothetical protein
VRRRAAGKREHWAVARAHGGVSNGQGTARRLCCDFG